MVSDDLTRLKIIDFGYATPLDMDKLAQASRFLRDRLSCTINYMAPELANETVDKPLDKADVFSLGVILVNLLSGEYFFDSVFEGNGTNLNRQYLSFLASPESYIKDCCSSGGLSSLIQGMLSFSLDKRFSIEEVLKHSWLTEGPISLPEEVRQELL
jgi:serine/threonine protein kinase